MKFRYSLCLAMVFLTAVSAVAQEKPTPQEAKKVIDYYYGGKDGVVLMEHKLCEGVYDQGEEKYECSVAITSQSIEQGAEAYLWMNFLVPTNETAKILLQCERNDQVRKTMTVMLTGATRFRTWKKIPTDQAGVWKIHILQEYPDSDIDIGTVQYSVSEPKP